jgi:hypothetical protein
MARTRFSEEEDVILEALAGNLDVLGWDGIARQMPGRSARQCRHRYTNYIAVPRSVKSWTCDEDELIMRQYGALGPRWVEISKMLVGRSGNDVKNRWYKHLVKVCPMRSNELVADPRFMAPRFGGELSLPALASAGSGDFEAPMIDWSGPNWLRLVLV